VTHGYTDLCENADTTGFTRVDFNLEQKKAKILRYQNIITPRSTSRLKLKYHAAEAGGIQNSLR
jgi:hypothetical protein